MIVQPTLVIPPELEARILSGELLRNAGVVRHAATGRIVKLLDEIPGNEKAQKALAEVAARLKDPRVYLPLVVVGSFVVGLVSYRKKRAPDVSDVPAVPLCVQRYNTSLAAYFEAIRESRLSLEILDRVIADLGAVKSYSDPDGRIILGFTTEHAETLVTIVASYTKQLAEANGITLDDPSEDTPSSEASEVVSLRHHLEVQKHIFTEAA